MGESNRAEETVIVTQVDNELEAAMLIDALKEESIKAASAGGITAGFRAEAPGGVNILVHQKDIETARVVIENFNNEHFNIDWDSQEIGDELDEDEEEEVE